MYFMMYLTCPWSKTSPNYKYKRSKLIEGTNNRIYQTYLTFYYFLCPNVFKPHVIFFSCLHRCPNWSAWGKPPCVCPDEVPYALTRSLPERAFDGFINGPSLLKPKVLISTTRTSGFHNDAARRAAAGMHVACLSVWCDVFSQCTF